MPVQSWFNALEDHGYRGQYEMEVYGPLYGALRYRQLLDDSTDCFRKLNSRSLRTPTTSGSR